MRTYCACRKSRASKALQAFEFGYLYRMLGEGYRNKYLVEGNNSRGIDVAIMMREMTRDGQPIEFVSLRSHAGVTFNSMGLYEPGLAATEKPNDRIFRRDCLEVDVRVGGRPLTIYAVHFKSMNCAARPRWTAASRRCRCGPPRRAPCAGSSNNVLARRKRRRARISSSAAT